MLSLITVCVLLISSCVAISPGNIHVALRQRNLRDLYTNAIAASDPHSPDYLHFWSTKEIQELVSPPVTVRKQVADWLVSNGVPINVIRDRGDALTFPYNPRYAETLSLLKPPGTVDMILGLEPVNGHCTPRVTQNGIDAGYVGREVIQRLYNVSNLVSKSSVGVGVVQYDQGEGFSQSDLNDYQRVNGLQPRNVSAEHMIGTNFGPGGEGELDIQMISNLDGAELWFISVQGWIYDFAADFFTWKEHPTVLSHSYGWSEYDQCTIVHCNNFTAADYVRRTNTELAKIALKGVTMLVSSGDAGSPGRTDESCQGTPRTNPVFPGSSPWVVSVGATYVTSSNQRSASSNTPLCKDNTCATGIDNAETEYNVTGWTSGSGFGVYSEPRNKWQQDAVRVYLDSGVSLPPDSAFNRNGRAYPDLSVVGHNCAMYQGGYLQGADGTSCSSPVMAALVGFISSELKTPLGIFSPALYEAYYRDHTLYNDVTAGASECTEAECCDSNWGFSPAKGWDVVSGLGTPNVGKLVERLRKRPKRY